MSDRTLTSRGPVDTGETAAISKIAAERIARLGHDVMYLVLHATPAGERPYAWYGSRREAVTMEQRLHAGRVVEVPR